MRLPQNNIESRRICPVEMDVVERDCLSVERAGGSTHAIRNFFGEHKVPVSSTKSMTGHLLGGAGGLEAGVVVLALRDQILPPTVNLESQDPETGNMDFVPNEARKASLDYALSNSFGFGGTNGAIVFKRWSE